jgi:hypothetical protein
MSDIEKQDLDYKGADGAHLDNAVSPIEGETEEVKRAREIQSSNKFLRALKNGEAWMDAKLGVESQGIDRVLEEKKEPPSKLNVRTIETKQ